eukprot:GEMP01006184.1.p1 GENE.GEMP01006184.1~~GEMP01006184.1.p1  ORF type:complete len:951 (+),score=179.18 GEMP01006184.1:892-3744(+)
MLEPYAHKKMDPKTWKIENIVPNSCMDTWNAKNGMKQGFVKAGDRIISVNGATPSIDNIANAPAPLHLELSCAPERKTVKHEEREKESFDTISTDDEDDNEILPLEVAIGKHEGSQYVRRGLPTDSVTEAIARRYYPMIIRLTRASGEDWGIMCDGKINQVMPKSINPHTAAARWNENNPKRAIIPGLTYFASVNHRSFPERMRWELMRADVTSVVLDLCWRGGDRSFKKRYTDDEGGTKKIPRTVVISGTGVVTCTPLNAVVGASVVRGADWGKGNEDCLGPGALSEKMKNQSNENATPKIGNSPEHLKNMTVKEARLHVPFYGAISHVHDWGWRVDAADLRGPAKEQKQTDRLHAGCMIKRIDGTDVRHMTSEASVWHLLSHPCDIEFYDAIHERNWVQNYESMRELEEDHVPFFLSKCFYFVNVTDGWYITDTKNTISGGSLLGRGCVISRVGPYLLRDHKVGSVPWAKRGKEPQRVCFYNEGRFASGTILSIDLATKYCSVKWKVSGKIGWYRMGHYDRYELALCEIPGEYVIGRTHKGDMVYYKSEAGHTLCLQRHGFNWTISHEKTTFARARAVYSDVPPPSNWEIWGGKWGPSNLAISAKLEFDPADEVMLPPISLSHRWPDNVECGALTLVTDVNDVCFLREGSVVERCSPFFLAIQTAFTRVLKISADDIGIVDVLEVAGKERMKVAVHISGSPGIPARDLFDQLRKLWSPGSPLFTLTASPLRRFVSAFDYNAGIQPCSAGCSAPGEPKVESYIAGGVKLKWQPPSFGRPVKYYQILMQVNSGHFGVRIPVAFGTTATIYPMAMDDTYRFRVQGMTDLGAGLESATSIAIFPQRWVLKSDRIMQLAEIEQRLKNPQRRGIGGRKSERARYNWEDHDTLTRENLEWRARDPDERNKTICGQEERKTHLIIIFILVCFCSRQNRKRTKSTAILYLYQQNEFN